MGQGNLFQNGSLASLNTPHEILSLRNARVNSISCGNNHCFVYFSPTGGSPEHFFLDINPFLFELNTFVILLLERIVKDLIPPSTLFSEIESALNKEEISDITFIVEGRKIFAHKFILALRCEKFRYKPLNHLNHLM
jgi:hypothetical protein